MFKKKKIKNNPFYIYFYHSKNKKKLWDVELRIKI